MTTAEIINIILVAVLVGITGYYAWQTKRQLDMLKEQRKRSINPVLQIGKINYIWNIFRGANDIQLLAPYLSIGLESVGAGPALELEISVTAIVLFQCNDSGRKKYFRCIWESHTESKEQFLEASTSETMNLPLIDAESMEIMDPGHEMIINLYYRNMDYQEFENKKMIPMGEKLYIVSLSSNDYSDNVTMPFDDNYSEILSQTNTL